MAAALRRLSWQRIQLKLRVPFRLAYGTAEERSAHVLHLEDGSGWGEGTIPPYYGIDFQQMYAFWEAVARRGDPFPEEPAAIPSWIGQDGPAPARAALDLALHDRIARRQGVPLYRLLELERPDPKITSFTLSLDTPQAMASAAAALPGYPAFKLKLGAPGDLERLEAVHAARPDARLRVDVNSGWSREQALEMAPRLECFDLELIEQPLARDDIEGLGLLQKRVRTPLVADESLQSLQDVDRLAAAGVRAINLKLMKVGGLAPGLAILRRARRYGMGVMLGCMVETSVGVTAAAHLAGAVNWLDLDAPLLVSNDPFEGLRYDEHARISLPEGFGIGVSPKEKESW